jgi:hypothetical protein
MSRSLRFDAAAERELNEAVDFYDLESPGLGDVFLAEVEHALTQVEAFPEAAEPVRDGAGRRLLIRSPTRCSTRCARTRSASSLSRSEAPAVLLGGSPVSAANNGIQTDNPAGCR